jgi:hypothetical protein
MMPILFIEFDTWHYRSDTWVIFLFLVPKMLHVCANLCDLACISHVLVIRIESFVQRVIAVRHIDWSV